MSLYPEAGNHKPEIYIENLGFADTDGVASFNVLLVVTTLSRT